MMVAEAQADAYRRGVLPMWTIYRRPRDFPDSYVARLSEVDRGEARMTDTVLHTKANAYGLEIMHGVPALRADVPAARAAGRSGDCGGLAVTWQEIVIIMGIAYVAVDVLQPLFDLLERKKRQ